MRTGDAEDNRHVADEVHALIGLLGQEVEKGRTRASWWGRIHVLLGLPAAVLAGVSGATGLSSEGLRVPAALLALISAGLAAAAGFLHPEVHAAEENTRSDAFEVMRDQAVLVMTQAKVANRDVRLFELEQLLELRRMIITGQGDILLRSGTTDRDRVRSAPAPSQAPSPASP